MQNLRSIELLFSANAGRKKALFPRAAKRLVHSPANGRRTEFAPDLESPRAIEVIDESRIILNRLMACAKQASYSAQSDFAGRSGSKNLQRWPSIFQEGSSIETQGFYLLIGQLVLRYTARQYLSD